MAASIKIDRTIVSSYLEEAKREPLSQDEALILHGSEQFLREIDDLLRYIKSPSGVRHYTDHSVDQADEDEGILAIAPSGGYGDSSGEVMRRYFREPLVAYTDSAKKRGESKFERIRIYIFREFYSALCENESKYKKEVEQVSSNSKLLIGAVAGYAAAKLGIAVTAVSGLAASVLWLILLIGRNSLCGFWKDDPLREVLNLPNQEEVGNALDGGSPAESIVAEKAHLKRGADTELRERESPRDDAHQIADKD